MSAFSFSAENTLSLKRAMDTILVLGVCILDNLLATVTLFFLGELLPLGVLDGERQIFGLAPPVESPSR